MKKILFISSFFICLAGNTQYTLDRVYDGTDSLYLKNGTDSLFRSVAGEYVFVMKTRYKKYVQSTDVIGGGGAAFPVGSVFISVTPTNPATLLGYGTWEAFGAGKTLVGFNSGDSDFDVAEETGGSKTQTIGATNLPQLSVTITDPGHNHVITELRDATTGSASTNIALTADASSTLGTKVTGNRVTGITATANTGAANTPVSIVQPYITVYMWKRIN